MTLTFGSDWDYQSTAFMLKYKNHASVSKIMISDGVLSCKLVDADRPKKILNSQAQNLQDAFSPPPAPAQSVPIIQPPDLIEEIQAAMSVIQVTDSGHVSPSLTNWEEDEDAPSSEEDETTVSLSQPPASNTLRPPQPQRRAASQSPVNTRQSGAKKNRSAGNSRAQLAD